MWTRSYDGTTPSVAALGTFNGSLYAGLGTSVSAGAIIEFPPLGGSTLFGT